MGYNSLKCAPQLTRIILILMETKHKTPFYMISKLIVLQLFVNDTELKKRRNKRLFDVVAVRSFTDSWINWSFHSGESGRVTVHNKC